MGRIRSIERLAFVSRGALVLGGIASVLAVLPACTEDHAEESANTSQHPPKLVTDLFFIHDAPYGSPVPFEIDLELPVGSPPVDVESVGISCACTGLSPQSFRLQPEQPARLSGVIETHPNTAVGGMHVDFWLNTAEHGRLRGRITITLVQPVIVDFSPGEPEGLLSLQLHPAYADSAPSVAVYAANSVEPLWSGVPTEHRQQLKAKAPSAGFEIVTTIHRPGSDSDLNIVQFLELGEDEPS